MLNNFNSHTQVGVGLEEKKGKIIIHSYLAILFWTLLCEDIDYVQNSKF